MFTSIIVTATAILGLASTAPSATPPTGVIQRITAGSTAANNGLHFKPENVVVEIGDLIEFYFLFENHTMTQSSFDRPCEPLSGGIFSGFNFATPAGESKNVFTFTAVGNHCQNGMSGVIDQNFDSPNTLSAYKAKAVDTTTKQPSASPMDFNGGQIVPDTSL